MRHGQITLVGKELGDSDGDSVGELEDDWVGLKEGRFFDGVVFLGVDWFVDFIGDFAGGVVVEVEAGIRVGVSDQQT